MAEDGVRLTEAQRRQPARPLDRHRRSRSAVLVAVFYVLTIVKLGPGVIDRPL